MNISAPFRVEGTTVVDTDGNLIGDISAGAGSIGTAEIADAAVTSAKLDDSTIQYAEVAITTAEIVGTAAGDLAHTDGVELVAAAGADEVLEFVSAVIIYDFDTAAYTGAGDDLVVRQAAVTVSGAITAAVLATSAADTINCVGTLATDYALAVNENINLFAGTEITQPGTAAGVIRVKVAYRVHTAGLA